MHFKDICHLLNTKHGNIVYIFSSLNYAVSVKCQVLCFYFKISTYLINSVLNLQKYNLQYTQFLPSNNQIASIPQNYIEFEDKSSHLFWYSINIISESVWLRPWIVPSHKAYFSIEHVGQEYTIRWHYTGMLHGGF